MTPEGVVKNAVKEYLKTLGPRCWYYMPVPMGYGKRGIPDFIICYRGFFLAPETKRVKGGVANVMQDRQQEEIRAAGGMSCRVNSVQEIKFWVQRIDDFYNKAANALQPPT